MIKLYKKTLRLFFLCSALALCLVSSAEAAAKYVFLFIGDGMGPAQRLAAEMYLRGMREASGSGDARESELLMNRLPIQGTIRTNSLDGVTDSAAAGTALATGQKTKNGIVAMDASGKKNLQSIARIAHGRGMKVGIVTSAFLQDATPAAFYGHEAKRTRHYALGLQLTRSGFEYFAGGGFRSPTDRDKKQKNLTDVARDNGYLVTNTRDGLLSLRPGARAIAVNPKLRAGSMPFVIDLDPSDIALSEFVRKGIELLTNERGFFMLVEGGNIDIACHANDAASSLHETIALDAALAEAVAFLQNHPDETLIVVAADHETGGLAISLGHGESRAFYDAFAARRGSYAAFERTVSPGRGTLDELTRRASAFFGARLSAADGPRAAYRMSMLPQKDRPTKDRAYKKLYGPYDPFTIACLRAADAYAGVSWSGFYHSGSPVLISAAGEGAELFSGEYDITEVFFKLRAAMGH